MTLMRLFDNHPCYHKMEIINNNIALFKASVVQNIIDNNVACVRNCVRRICFLSDISTGIISCF